MTSLRGSLCGVERCSPSLDVTVVLGSLMTDWFSLFSSLHEADDLLWSQDTISQRRQGSNLALAWSRLTQGR